MSAKKMHPEFARDTAQEVGLLIDRLTHLNVPMPVGLGHAVDALRLAQKELNCYADETPHPEHCQCFKCCRPEYK